MTREKLEAALSESDGVFGYFQHLQYMVAMEFGDDDKDGKWLERLKAVVVAARKQLALMPERCIDCGGSGVGSQSISYVSKDYPCLTCHGSGKVYPQETVEAIAKALGEMFLYPDPNNEGNWMGPGIEASRQVAVAVLDALGETEEARLN